jgi:hypothetical protein
MMVRRLEAELRAAPVPPLGVVPTWKGRCKVGGRAMRMSRAVMMTVKGGGWEDTTHRRAEDTNS